MVLAQKHTGIHMGFWGMFKIQTMTTCFWPSKAHIHHIVQNDSTHLQASKELLKSPSPKAPVWLKAYS
jgi:hypothetical protein